MWIVLSQVISKGELPAKNTIGLLEKEKFEFRQSSALPGEGVGVHGTLPMPIMVEKNIRDWIPGLKSL